MIVDGIVGLVVVICVGTGFCRGVDWKTKDAKYVFDVKFDGGVDWGVGVEVGRCVGAGVGIGIVDEVDSDVSDEGAEGFEW